MIKFNVISDTHRISGEVIEKLVPVFNSGSFLVHLGDGTDDLIPFQKKVEMQNYQRVRKLRLILE